VSKIKFDSLYPKSVAMFSAMGKRIPSASRNLYKISFRSCSSTASKMTLYHCLDARSLRCLWTLEEMSIKDYKLITMPFPPRIFFKKFLKINPLGTIPYFVDGDVKMTESSGGIFLVNITF
jgi:hypothetical protein